MKFKINKKNVMKKLDKQFNKDLKYFSMFVNAFGLSKKQLTDCLLDLSQEHNFCFEFSKMGCHDIVTIHKLEERTGEFVA